jgi:hypothetical protein
MGRREEHDSLVMQQLSNLDRFLPLWIAIDMAGGLALGSLVPGINDALESLPVFPGRRKGLNRPSRLADPGRQRAHSLRR